MTITITFRGILKCALTCLCLYLCLVAFILFDSFFTCWTCGEHSKRGFDAQWYAMEKTSEQLQAGAITKEQYNSKFKEHYEAKSTELERSPAN